MDNNGNPFGAPPPQPPTNTLAAGNPFGVSVVEAPPHQQNPWGAPPPPQSSNESVGGYSSAHSTQPNPFGAPPPVQLNNYGMEPQVQYQNPYQAPPQNPQGYAVPPHSNNPFGAPLVDSSAVVVATNQSNPYAVASPYQYGQQHQGQIVPVTQHAQPWSVPQQTQQFAPHAPGFDPFAQPPPPAPVPAPEAVSHDIDLFLQPQAHQELPVQQPEPQVQKREEPIPAASTREHDDEPPMRRGENDNGAAGIKEAPDVAAPPQGTMYPPQIQYGHRPDIEPDPEPTNVSPRNPYAPVLAREAPPGASPLPKAELVRKRGFALSRISFRTIVMKKWKQTYWVQYGPHTMLWFRSQADFDDWLNNPYHMQTERNFLIKLAVNFVHDLYKPNVRGYQVTQCRTKGYGNKIVRQFKLERWMDYGPTIAAAFGSYDPVEIDTLREAIVECMRNTPLEGGIRATGAVRQSNPNSSMPPRRERDDDDDDEDDEDDNRNHSSNVKTNEIQQDSKPKEIEPSISEEADLLDVNNWDDVPSEPQQHILSNPVQQHPYMEANGQVPHGALLQQSQASVQAIQPYSGPDTNPYGMAPQQHYPPQQPSYSTAIVPSTNPTQSYPGIQPHQQQQWIPPQQQQWMPPPQQHPPPQQQFQQQGYPPQTQVNYPHQPQQNPQQPAYQQQVDPWATPQAPIQMQPPQY